MSRYLLVALFAIAFAFGTYFAIAADRSPDQVRADADRALKAGNFKDAYENGFSKLAVDPHDDPAKVSDDLTSGITCLRSLGRSDELDGFREAAIAAHGGNWRLLQSAAQTYLTGENYGFIVAGKFYRGNHRGNDGKQVMTIERDRIRAMQLMQQAMPLLANEADKGAAGQFYFNFAEIVLDNRFGNGAWRLQYLSDLSKLPDYEEGYRYYGGNNNRGGAGESRWNASLP